MPRLLRRLFSCCLSRWSIVSLFALILSAMLRYSRLCFRYSISRSRSAIRLAACSVPGLSGLSDPVRPASVLSSAKVLPPARRSLNFCIRSSISLLKFKCWYYETAMKDGNEDTINAMLPDKLPKNIQKLYDKGHE